MGATASNAQSKTARADKVDSSDYGPGNATVVEGGLAWTMVEEVILAETIAAVAAVGDAISFAQGRRGAWLSVTILHDGARPRWEARTVQEMNAILVDLGNKARARK